MKFLKFALNVFVFQSYFLVLQGDEYLCPLCRVKLSKEFIKKLQTQDQFGMFAEPVTKKVARNYYDIIRNPMDLATMTSKAQRLVVGSVDCSAVWLFLYLLSLCVLFVYSLIVLNLLLFKLSLGVCTNHCKRCAKTLS